MKQALILVPGLGAGVVGWQHQLDQLADRAEMSVADLCACSSRAEVAEAVLRAAPPRCRVVRLCGRLAPRTVVATKPKRDPKREERITMEVVVDCYNRHEVAMGWFYYLEGRLQFPFTATCIAQRAVSPLRVKDEVEVIGMPPEEECECEVFVKIRWDRLKGLAVPLAQLQPIRATDAQSKEAVADWHYWRSMGYEY